jgi:catechol 2,3-dioxygenase-like lactoylglutathione lyase family enzyme
MASVEDLKALRRPRSLPFKIRKIGHMVLGVSDVARSVEFYTQIVGLEVSDVYPDEMVPGKMVFMRFNHDHHGLGLIKALPGESPHQELHHIAFEVGTLDEVIRAADFLREKGVRIDFEGRRRAGSQISVEFQDPDGHRIEFFWGVDQVGSEGTIRPSSQWKWAHSFREAIEDPCVGQDTTLADPNLLRERV